MWQSKSIRLKSEASATESVGYYKLKQNKPWFDDECSKLLDQRKQAICSGCRIQVKRVEVIWTMYM